MIDAKLSKHLDRLRNLKSEFERAAPSGLMFGHELLQSEPHPAEWWQTFIEHIYYERVVVRPDGKDACVIEGHDEDRSGEYLFIPPLGSVCERLTGSSAHIPAFDALAAKACDTLKAISILTDHPEDAGLWHAEVVLSGRLGWMDLVYRTARLYPVTCDYVGHWFGSRRHEAVLYEHSTMVAAKHPTWTPSPVEILRCQGDPFTTSARVIDLWLEPPRPPELEVPVPINLHRLVLGTEPDAPGRTSLAGETVTHPTWDPDRRELRWGAKVLKRYSKPAENQIALLTAFEEDGWPPVIDDPFPQRGKTPWECQKRLGDTVRALNQNMLTPKIIFDRDGTGERVRWRTVV